MKKHTVSGVFDSGDAGTDSLKIKAFDQDLHNGDYWDYSLKTPRNGFIN